MTLLLMITLCFYGFMQSVKLIEYDETDVMLSHRDAYFSSDFVWSKDLMYAFGISAYDNDPEPIEDPSYGVVKPYYKSWGLIKDVRGVHWQEIPTRACSKAELNVGEQSDPDTRFFEPHKNSASDLSFYHKKLKCLDQESVEV